MRVILDDPPYVLFVPLDGVHDKAEASYIAIRESTRRSKRLGEYAISCTIRSYSHRVVIYALEISR